MAKSVKAVETRTPEAGGPCGCRVEIRLGLDERSVTHYCPLHAAAPALLAVAKTVDTLFVELTAETRKGKDGRATNWGVVNTILCDAVAAIRASAGG